MTHYSFKCFLKFAWGIFTGEILLFHNLHLNPEIDLLHKDKRGEQVTKEEIMRIRKITGHYLVKMILLWSFMLNLKTNQNIKLSC